MAHYMRLKSVFKFISLSEVSKYVESSDRSNDLIFYLFFIVQTTVLPSIPSGFHSPNFEGWLGFFMSSIFFFIFYPLFYNKFYRINPHSFIREAVVLSVVARINSFFCIGLFALLQITIWTILKLPKIPYLSMFYYMAYYVTFSAMMIYCKNKISNN